MGELEPCHCSGREAGGLPARGGYLEQQQGERLLVDIGCMGRGARDFELLRLDAVLRAMDKMRYDAANIGEYELWLGSEDLAKRLGAGVPLVSANVTDDDGKALAKPFLIIKRAGLSVAITGVTASGQYLTGPGVKVGDPVEALARIMPEMRRQAGVVVVLADLDVVAAREMAQQFPEVSLLLYRGRGDSHPPEKVNRGIIASVSGELRFIGDVTLTWGGDGEIAGEGVPVLLKEGTPQSAAVMQAAVEWYKNAIHGKRFGLGQAKPGWRQIAADRPKSGDQYAGSPACEECHAAAHAVWKESRHAHALASLEKAGYDCSPECVVCHVVGYGAPDGYVSATDTPAMANVGCECCHARGGRHAASAQGKEMGSIVRGDGSACQACHTPRHSRGFVQSEAWAKIAHKEKK